MKYNPTSIFQDPIVAEEFRRLGDLLGLITADDFAVLYAPPKRLKEGMVVICDGDSWNPVGDGIKQPIWYDKETETWKVFGGGGGGGGSGVVITIAGTEDEINVDNTDPEYPVLSLAAVVSAILVDAETAVQPADLDAYQPVDSDLTAIAALTTTSFGRGFLALADAAAALAYIGAAGTGASESAYNTAIAARSPTAHWKLDETSGTTLTDTTGGFNLTTTGTVQLADAYITDDLAVKFIATNTTAANGGSASTKLGLTAPFTSDYSVQGIILRRTTGDAYILSMGAAGETEAANYQVEVSILSGVFNLFWENGAGTNNFVASIAQVPVGVPVHFAITKNASTKVVTFYQNGKKVSGVSYSTEVTGGTGTLTTSIGLDVTNSSAPTQLAHISFHYGVLFTADQVRDLAISCGLFS